MLVTFDLDAAHVGAGAADIAQLIGQTATQRLDSHFQLAGGEGEFGAQLILVGTELGHAHRRRRLDALLGEAHGATPDGGHEQQGNEGRAQQAQREIHDVFKRHIAFPSSADPVIAFRTP